MAFKKEFAVLKNLSIAFLVFTGLFFATSFSPDAIITTGEYFFDSDPGPGLGTSISLENATFGGTFVNLEFQIDTAGFTPGPHTFFLRMKNSNGKWGPVRQKKFELSSPDTVSRAETLVDADHGEGFGTAMVPTEGVLDSDESFYLTDLDVSAFPPEDHNLYIRYQDAENGWEGLENTPFFVDGQEEFFLNPPERYFTGDGDVPFPVPAEDQWQGSESNVEHRYSTDAGVHLEKATLAHQSLDAGASAVLEERPLESQIPDAVIYPDQDDSDDGYEDWVVAVDLPANKVEAAVLGYSVHSGPAEEPGSDTSPISIDDEGPSAPSLIPFSSKSNCVSTPSLSWRSGKGAQQYHIQVSSTADFGALLIDTKTEDPFYASSTSFPSGAVFWRVSSIDANGKEGPFSRVESFTLTADTSAPTVELIFDSETAGIGPLEIKAVFSEALEQAPNISIDQEGSADVLNQPMTGNGTSWVYSYEVQKDDGGQNLDGKARVHVSKGFDCGGNENLPPKNNTFLISTTPLPGTITGAEYFIDTDPGEGRGTAIVAPDDGAYDSPTESVTVQIDTAKMKIGFHTVFVRFKNSGGRWGLPKPVSNPLHASSVPNFEVQGALFITGGEYFFDIDPGLGQGTAVSAKDGVFDEKMEDVDFSIDSSSLPPGSHTLFLRMRDSNGDWGPVRETKFDISHADSDDDHGDDDHGDDDGEKDEKKNLTQKKPDTFQKSTTLGGADMSPLSPEAPANDPRKGGVIANGVTPGTPAYAAEESFNSTGFTYIVENPDGVVLSISDSRSDGVFVGRGEEGALISLTGTATIDSEGDEGSTGEGYRPEVSSDVADSDGEGISDLNDLNPAAAESPMLELTEPQFQVTVGGERTVHLIVRNFKQTADTIFLSLTGIDPSWYAIENNEVFLLPGQKRVVQIRVKIPVDCSLSVETYAFEVTGFSALENEQANARGTLFVSPDPIHTPLLQPVQGVYGNNSIYVAWKTDSPTTTDFFYKAVSDSDFTVFQGPPGLEHRVELPGLLWGETYQWYAESHSQCGMTQTETNSGVISRGVTFDLRGSEVAINRDYNQLVSMNITNIDYFEHAAMVRVINPYDDIGAGFVGVGTETEIVEISPGETITPQLFVHAGDALETRYVLYAEVTTDPFSPDPIYDRVPIVVNIRPVDVNLDLEEIEKSIFSMTNSYRLMNYGDTIPDVKVFVKDPVSSRVVINPAVNHGRLESGEFLEFVISGSEPVNGVLVAEGNLQTITIPFQLGCRKEQNLQNVTMTGPTVEIDLEDWYFTDRQDLEIPFSFPSGYTRDAIERAYLKVTFNPVQPKNPTKAYTVKLFANDELISTFFDETPEGEYFIGIPVHLLQIATYGTGTNSLRLRVEGTDEGAHFVVTDMKAGIVLDQMNMQVCANETPPPTCPDCALFPPPPPFPERLDVDGVYQP